LRDGPFRGDRDRSHDDGGPVGACGYGTGARIVKFTGGYHGHADMFLVAAGSGAATFGTPDSPGVTPGAVEDTRLADVNDLDSVRRCFGAVDGQVAAVIVEPVVGNMGCVPPAEGFLEGLRELCTRQGAVLIFDEVMSGFRVARGGAAERYGITPDLVTLGKIVGGGVPLAAVGGRASLMGQLAPAGPVYQAGTYAAHPLAVAAGLATLEAIDALAGSVRGPRAPQRPIAAGSRVRARPPPAFRYPCSAWFDVDRVLRRGHPLRPGGMRQPWIVPRTRGSSGHVRRGVLLPPSPFESAFLSIAHDDAVVEETLHAAGPPSRRHADERSISQSLSPRARGPDARLDHAPGRPLPARVSRPAPARGLPDAVQDARAGGRGVAAAAAPLSAGCGDPLLGHPAPAGSPGLPDDVQPGPEAGGPIRTRAQVDALERRPAAMCVPFVADAVRLLRQELQGRRRSSDFAAPRSRSPPTWCKAKERKASARSRA
jgi:hypothetical protein